jgi:release factor glutamine methyltransferase
VPGPGNLVLEGSARLELGPHPDRARRDAETLLLHVLQKSKSWLMAHGEEPLSAVEAARYAELLERRFHGEPIQYITGETEFYALPFRVTPDVLIPRPETEQLVEKVIEWAARFATRKTAPGIPPLRILDVGTGSGAIAVAVAHHLPQAEVTAIDLSAAALAVAQGNAEANKVAGRIRFLEGDLLAPVAGESFDVVVSNPPYVPLADRDSLSVEVRDYEPALALFAGEDGIDVYRRLIPAASSALASGGLLALELGYGQDQAVAALLENAGFHPIELLPDLQGIPRIACAWRR